jgi:hypothetical protein
MATNHAYIYLGMLDEDDDIIKIGMTRQTCYARSNTADFTIQRAYEIYKCRNGRITLISQQELRAVEKEILQRYRNKYCTVRGMEYFKAEQNIRKLSIEFEKEMNDILQKADYMGSFFREPVQPYYY